MEYDEYLKCADKHIKSCQQILEGLKHNGAENKEAFLDVWYLSGYILEGCTIYSVYKLKGWNPPTKDKDIKRRFHYEFTKKTHLDFFGKEK